jgi:hypothetical protein
MVLIENRICYSCWLVIMALIAPFWVTVAFCIFGMMTMDWYIEGVVLVMILEYIARAMHYGGYVGWVLFLGMIVLYYISNSLWSSQKL